MPSADVVVVGAGIAGLTTALAVADRRNRVLVFDQHRHGAASRAAAGMLAPSVEGLPDNVLPAAIAARDFYPEFLARLATRTGMSIPLDRRGILELASTTADLAVLVGGAAENAEVLDAAALVQLEPQLGGHAGALFHPCDGAVDNVALMHALEDAVARQPRIERIIAAVDSVAFGRDGAIVTTTTSQSVACGHVVLAPGAWMAGINGLPRIVPVRPVGGQLLLLPGGAIGHVTYGAGGYLVPRGSGLIIGATSDEVGFECRPTDAGRSALLAIAHAASRALRDVPLLEHWSGLRPMSPDSLPVLGADPDVPALVYSCGFSRNGILLAPWAAGHVAALISSASAPDVLEPFSIMRFYSKP